MGLWDMQLRAVRGIPMISAGADLGAVIAGAVAADGHALRDDDVLVVAQKVVSKAEGRVRALDTVSPSAEARDLARRSRRDPRLCQLIINEADTVVEVLDHRYIVTVDTRGLTDTSSGVDSGNAGRYDDGWACLLPEDPDASARRIRDRIRELAGAAPAVIISDSMGSPFRKGSAGAAIGVAGIAAVQRSDGEKDLYGNPVTGDIDRVDELAGAAGALMGQGGAGFPVVIIRGADWTPDETASIRELLMPDPAGSFPLARRDA